MLSRPTILLAFLATGVVSAQAQEIARGRVLSASNGSPLPGVRVTVAGTRLSALTDDRGAYSIELPPGARTLVFRLIGYRTLEAAIDGRAAIDVSLEPAALTLDEVVVTGYTTQQRRNVSDATAGASGDQIREHQAATLEEALRGRMAGIQVSASGEPGRPAEIIIRGQNFFGNPTPLYVVDGMYLGQNPNLNPDDIESIEVLKDASAAAQYGAQAANGVVVIRTRRGAGDTRVELRSYYGFHKIAKRVEMMNTTEWAALAHRAYANAGWADDSVPAAVVNPPSMNTDWQDAVFNTGAITDHAVTVSGGAASAGYLISGGYLRQEGAIIETAFRRYSFRVNSQIQRGRLTLGEHLALSSTRRDLVDGFPLIDVVRFPPAIPVYDSTTTSGFGFGSDAVPTFGTNPVGALRMRDNWRRSNQVIGSAFAELELLTGLRYRFNAGVNHEDFTQRDFIRRGQLRFRNPLEPARLWDTQADNTSLLLEHLLTFDGRFGAGTHQVGAVAGYTEQRQTVDRLGAYREGFTDEDLRVIDAGERSNLDNGGSRLETALRAFLVRVNYVYRDRYLFTASLRRDGSSRFAPGNRYGTFGAGSVGWVLSEAPFVKLRASHGVLGNQDIGDYRFSAPIEQNLNYLFGPNAVSSGATQITLANPNIRWQSNRQTNLGLDAGLFGDRLGITADYYVSDSDGLLVEAPIPWSLGTGAPGREAGIPVVNAGSVRNTGFELGATHRLERGDLRLTTGIALATTRNRVLELGNGGQPITAGPFGVARTEVDLPIGTFWVLKTNGIFQSDAEVQAHGAQPDAKPGDVRYVDLGGPQGIPDGRIDDHDRYAAGNAIPDVTGSLFVNGLYRRLDFALALRGSAGGKIFNVARYWTERMDDISNFRKGLQPWTPENRSTATPRAVIGAEGAMNANPLSDRWIESGSFLRIQNVSLGYRLPGEVGRWLRLPTADVRVYVNVQNLHTFTGFSNWDPETLGFGDPLARGIDDGAIYPNPRTVTFGIDLRL